MSKIRINNYTFNKTAKTISFTDYKTISLDGLLLITNVTSNIIIYNFASPALGGSVSGNTLTLNYDTSSMSNTDKLQILYDDPNTNSATDESILLLRRIVKELESSATVDRANRQRVVIDGYKSDIAGNTIDCLGAVLTGSNVGLAGQSAQIAPPYNSLGSPWFNYTWEGPVDQRFRVAEDSHISYQLGIRSHLTFS